MNRLCSVSELADGKLHAFSIDGHEFCATTVDNEVFVIDNTCPHADVALADGEREGHVVECFLHGARFDLRTGAVLSPPATQPVRTYSTHVEGDDVLIEIER